MSQPAADLRYGCPTCRAVFRTGFSRCPSDGSPMHLLDADPLVGERFADRYLIEDCAAEGGMGRIYRARHVRVSRRFAIKILFGELAMDPKMRERFTREAEAASRLDHANVASVVDFGETDAGLLYLVMDFIEGRALSDLLAAEAPLSPERTRRLVRQLAAGLGHAHDQDLIHRDFKPDNVLVTGTGSSEQVKIVDFGIALTTEQLSTSRLTTQGVVFGTPAYMAPEQSTGCNIDSRVDLFALGVILYEMLSGVLPFSGTQRQLAAQNLAVTAPPIAERVPGLVADPGLEAIAHTLMAKKPDDRFPDARAVLAALEAAEAQTGTASRLTTEGDGPIAPRSSRRPAIAVGAALLSIAAAAAIVGRGDEAAPRATAEVVTPAVEAPPRVQSATPEPEQQGTAEHLATAGADADTLLEAPAETAASAADAGEPDAVNARAPQKRAPRVRDRRARRDQAASSRVGAQDAAPSSPDPTASDPSAGDLQSLYVRVGRSLHRLDGQTAGVPELYRRYERIPIADALRKPALRLEALRALRDLEADIARARRR